MSCRFMRYPGGKPKAVTLSYDDGRATDIRLAQVLDAYGLKCTFNLSSGLIPATENGIRMTPEQIRCHILKSGHEIAVHGQLHKPAGCYYPVEMIQDTVNCRLELETMFHTIVRGMAYTCSGITKMHNGNDYATIRQYMQSCGIVYARSLGGDNNRFMLPEDWLNWVPTAHHDHPKTLQWAEEFIALDLQDLPHHHRYPRLFYLWGDSLEFQGARNWDLLDAICEILSNRDDVWYATNMEIYDYVQAYQSLIYSADTTRVYNPTRIPVWLNLAGSAEDTFCVLPGQTITLGTERNLSL